MCTHLYCEMCAKSCAFVVGNRVLGSKSKKITAILDNFCLSFFGFQGNTVIFALKIVINRIKN